MNVPMYDREKERELDKTLAEKEARWEQAGLLTRQTALEIEARRQSQYSQLQTILQDKHVAFQKGMQNRVMQGSIVSGQPNQNIFASTPKSVYADPNTVPELQMSLEDAYNMWLVRFGDKWVKGEDVQDADGFNWSQLASRLRDIRLLEQLPNTWHCRLVPHVWK